jgi:hypothetical protein
VDEIHKENNLRIDEDGASARLLKNGLYDFDANQGEARVFGGQAIVQEHGRQIKVKAGHELLLTDSTKAQRFDKHSAEDSFYRWSSLRSDYLAEANADAARYYYQGGFAWLGGSWYWDPWFGAYTFVPGSGLLYSPFGWAYYSPWWGYEPPFFTYGRAFHHFGHDFDHYRGNRRAVIPGNGFTPDLRRSFGRAPMRQGEPHLSPRLFSAGRGFHGLGQRR